MDKNYNFYALASRLKYITRWGLMRNTQTENVSEHSYSVSIIAHGLALINNCIFGGDVSPEKTAVVAIYHDVSEILTGDMPTPVKYCNPAIVSAYKNIEDTAKEKMIEKLPELMRESIKEILFAEKKADYCCRLVKAADKLSAYIKCIEEENDGNKEFVKAKESILKSITEMNIPEADYFIEKFIPSFYLTLDEM